MNGRRKDFGREVRNQPPTQLRAGRKSTGDRVVTKRRKSIPSWGKKFMERQGRKISELEFGKEKPGKKRG